MRRQSGGLVLIIASAGDECAERVACSLRSLGREVIVSPDPLVEPHALTWRVGSLRSEDTISWGAEPHPDRKIGAVFVRGACESVRAREWTPKDAAYAQSERHAALLAWLWGLRCPVVNRPAADLWFRPRRSYPEWRAMFLDCGLPPANICLTNQIETARDWARRWAGRATYAPITSSSRYPLDQPAHWDELGKLAACMPVCLLPPCAASPSYGTLIGSRVVWDGDVASDVAALEPALFRLAARLGLELLQIEIARDDDGLHCLSLDPQPQIARHDAGARAEIIAGVVEVVLAAERGLRPTARGIRADHGRRVLEVAL